MRNGMGWYRKNPEAFAFSFKKICHARSLYVTKARRVSKCVGIYMISNVCRDMYHIDVAKLSKYDMQVNEAPLAIKMG